MLGGSQAPPGLPRKFPELPRKFPATSPEVLSLWNLTAIQRFSGSSPNFPLSSLDFPGGQPLSLGILFCRHAARTERRLGRGHRQPQPEDNLSRKGFCRNPRGIFPNKVPGEFCGGFFGGFFRAFSLENIGGKKSTKKSTAKLKSEFGSFAAKIRTARIRP